MRGDDPDLALLSSLVGDPDRFAEHHWGRRPMHRATGDTFRDLLAVDQIEALLLSSARHPTFRLVRDGTTLPLDQAASRVRLGGRDLDDVADVAKIAAAIDDGATLVVQGLQRTTLPIARFCRSLERAISHPVQANAYLSPPGTAGLGSHRDDHDVLALQLDGTKHWVVDGLGAIAASRGDLLYLPAGTRHEAATRDERSLHLTIGIIRVTMRHAVHRALREVDALDDALPLGFARDEHAPALERRIGDALAATTRALSEVEPAAAATAERARARRRRPALLVGHLASILELDALDAGHGVAWRSDVLAVVEAGPGPRFTLALPDRRITMPVAMRPAVEHLLGGDPVVVGSLPGLDPESRLVLVRRLVREGVLAVTATHPCADAPDAVQGR